jgi:hypothetical protein
MAGFWRRREGQGAPGGLATAAALIVLLGTTILAQPRTLTAQTVTLSGTWVSKASVAGNKEGTWQLSGSPGDSGLNGSFTASGPADVKEGNVFGAYIPGGGDIQFGILYNDVEEATFTGTVNGAIASGTYSTRSGDSGTWTGTIGGGQ